jgi:hypothetical protein
MSSTALPQRGGGSFAGIFSRDRSMAGFGYSRWMVPPAALCVHLCIGQAYAFSVFNLPMTKLIGITQSAPNDWKLTDLGWIFDMFGTRYVGAIHGMLLTAWSMAGIFGPVLVNYIRQYNVDHGVARAAAYNVTMYVMAALLIIGFLCNLFIRGVDERHHMKHDQADAFGMSG